MPITSGAPCPSACGLALPPPGPGLQPLWEVPGNRITGPFSRPPRIPLAPRAPSAGQARFKDGPRGVTARLGPGPGDPAHEARRRAARPPARPPHLLSRSCRTFPGCAGGRGRCSSGPGGAAAGQQAGASAALLGRCSPRLTLAPAWRAPRGRGQCARRPRSSPHRASRSATPPPAQPPLRGSEPPAAAPRRRPPAGLGPAATAPPAGSPPPAPQRPLLARSRDKPGERRSTPCRPGVVPNTDQHGPSHRERSSPQTQDFHIFPHGRCRTFCYPRLFHLKLWTDSPCLSPKASIRC